MPLRESTIRGLVVEDDEGLAYAMRARLERAGMQVDEASTASDALDLLSRNQYDAVVLDLIMKGPLNGFSVITFLETEQPLLLERLFITSGMPEQTILHAAPALLPRFYRKPIDVEEVVAAVMRRISEKPADVRIQPAVLIIDDDENQRALMAELVRRLDRTTEQAMDGHEAIRKLATRDYAAVVIDLVLPYVDGYGVLRYLREERPKLLKRTVVVTGMPEVYRSRALLAEACAVLDKPIDSARLQAVIAECIR